MSEHQSTEKVALISGGAKRIGASIARRLHENGYRIIIHYHHSQQAAEQLAAQFNQQRPDSAISLRADLTDEQRYQPLIAAACQQWGRLDALINNASSFYATPVGNVLFEQWHDLLATNLKAPFFLAQAASHALGQQQGCIINITDIHASKPLKQHSVYCIAKAGLTMLTKSLARELAPAVRVNAIAPGAIAWPEQDNALSDDIKQQIIAHTPLKRTGHPSDIAAAVQFLVEQHFITGQTLAVDGGRGMT